MFLDNNQLEKALYAVWLCREKKKFLRENLDKTVICKLANNIKLIPWTYKINFSFPNYSGTAQHFLIDTKHTQNAFYL